MKKQILIATAVLFSAGMIFLTGCKKDDTTGPVITMAGSASESSILNAPWVDLGATAEDDEDGVVTVTVSGTVNKDLTGDYIITYTATDAAGNESTAKRTVTVYNEAEILENTWSVHDSCGVGAVYNYAQTVTASTVLNNKILFNKFGDYTGNTGIYAMVSATTITLPSQSAVGIGTASQNHTFSGTGTITTGVGFTITYTDVNTSTVPSTSATCIAKFQ